MVMKNKKQNKKTINKWKLTALISLAINGLVACLLAIGLAVPKANYVSVSAESSFPTGYVWESKHELNYESHSWSTTTDYLTGISGVTIREQQKYIRISVGRIYSYLDNSSFSVNTRYVWFRFSPSVQGNTNTEYFLSSIEISSLTFPDNTTGNYVVSSVNWYSNPVHTEFRDLGYDSPYVIFENVEPRVEQFFRAFFNRLGFGSLQKNSFQINDNFNPNKYISIAESSLGFLYGAPNPNSSADSHFMWVVPQYAGTLNSKPYSNLGFIQIPFAFESNGKRFLGIRLYYDVVISYIDKNGEYQTLIDSLGSQPKIDGNYHYTFVYMSYYYEDTYKNGLGPVPYNISELPVCAVPVYRIFDEFIENNIQYRDYSYMPFEPYKWLNDNYKIITPFDFSQVQLDKVGLEAPINTKALAISNLTIEEILNYDMNIDPLQINNGGNAIGNVFALIKLAFDSVVSLFAISIIPGISIGILLFLPLVLTIIIVIIKLVKR